MNGQQVKSQREDSILLSLKKLDYLSRSQLQRLHHLSGDRNALRVLDNMSEYVYCFRGQNGENIYYLNKNGRERVNCEVVRQKSDQVNHYLMRNDVYIHFKPSEWSNEMKFIVPEQKLTIIADAFFRYNQMRHFLEVDHKQHMFKNRQKVERYRKLKATGTLQEKYKYFPRLMWVTMAESRKRQLEELCEGLNTVVHTWDEIK